MARRGAKRKRGQQKKDAEAGGDAEPSSSQENLPKDVEKKEEEMKEDKEAKEEEEERKDDKEEEEEEEKKGDKEEEKEGKEGNNEGKEEEKKKDKKEKKKQQGKPAANKRAKKAPAKEPEPEPEYFEDKRNLEDLWKSAFPVGTEWDQLDKVYEFNWNFSNLEDAFEEGGILYGKKVYLFGCSEPQLVPVKGIDKVISVPAVVAVVSPFPPSDKIGIKSVQRETEEIVPMKQMKMDWAPYIPLEKRDRQVDRLKSQIFILTCYQRRVALRHLKIERVKKFEYCLPYFYNPFKEDELEQSTEVQIIFPAEPKPVFCEFDWEMDELGEFTDGLIQEEALPEDQKDAFKEFVKEKVREAKKANREAREARQKTLQEMSEDMKKAYAEMKFYKFYPVESPDTPDISKVKAPFINRYYGKAHEVL